MKLPLTFCAALLVYVSVVRAQADAESLTAYARNIRIVSATWGAGNIFIDETAQVRRVLGAPEQEFPVSVGWLEHDPAFDVPKVLITVFEYGGQSYILNLDEGARIGVERLRACIRNRTRQPPDGPPLVGKDRPTTAAELTRFMAGTVWNIHHAGEVPGLGWTFHADGTLTLEGTGYIGNWRAVGADTLRMFDKDVAVFNDDYTRWRSAGDAIPYFGLLVQ